MAGWGSVHGAKVENPGWKVSGALLWSVLLVFLSLYSFPFPLPRVLTFKVLGQGVFFWCGDGCYDDGGGEVGGGGEGKGDSSKGAPERAGEGTAEEGVREEAERAFHTFGK